MDAFTIGKQLNITDDKILRKAEELIRLTKVRAPHGIGVSEICKGVICLDLASSVLGKSFDRKTAMTLASITTKDYQPAYNSIQNILQIRPNISFEEISSQFNCSNIASECHKFFEGYKEKFLATVEEHRRPYADFSYPVFNSVVFFIVARLNKLVIDKNKLMEIGMFSPREFQSVYESMTTLCEVVFPTITEKRKREPSAEEIEEKRAKNAAYEEWKKKALTKETSPDPEETQTPQNECKPASETVTQEQSQHDTTEGVEVQTTQQPSTQATSQEPSATEQPVQQTTTTHSEQPQEEVSETEPINDENSSKNINQHESSQTTSKQPSKPKAKDSTKPKPKLKQLTLFSFNAPKRSPTPSLEVNDSPQT